MATASRDSLAWRADAEPSVQTSRPPKRSRPGRRHTAGGRNDEMEPAVLALLVFYGLAILCANLALVAGL